jgi:short subunit dehydrogenase-like uncharacterized protein
MITLFGATGVTGQLIASVLAREELPFRLAGRSANKLAALSAGLPGNPNFLVADASQPDTLTPLYQDSRLLINVAGPFTDLGEPVISRAAMGGTHYIDMTNELGFVFRMRGYHSMAARTGSALVPAAGFEVALSDCAAALLVDRMGGASPKNPIDQIDVVYQISGTGASAGTRLSAVRSLATSWVAYRDGDWVGQVPGGSTRRFNLPSGKRRALSFPSSESVTIPAHIPISRVDAWMTVSPKIALLAPVGVPIFARLARSILRPLLLKLAAAGGQPAKGSEQAEARSQAGFTILVQAKRGVQSRWMTLQGKDPYGITAEIIGYFVRQMTQPGFDRSGLLAPAQVVDPQAFLDFATQHWGLTIQEGEGIA